MESQCQIKFYFTNSTFYFAHYIATLLLCQFLKFVQLEFFTLEIFSIGYQQGFREQLDSKQMQAEQNSSQKMHLPYSAGWNFLGTYIPTETTLAKVSTVS